MSYRGIRICIATLLVCAGLSATAQVPFHKGVNLTNWFQAASPRQIQFTKYTRKDFENIKSLGCDVIRLPINLHAMTSGAPDYTLDPLFLTFLDKAIEWSEELQLHLILDNHTFDPSVSTSPDVEDILVKVWPQLAKRYKDHSDFLLYEVLNEPHGIADDVWGPIQQAVIDAIRLEDTRHYIVVGGVNYNSYNNLATLPVYSDSKLIYTFHFYDPFLFTHQGASWVEPSLVPLKNMPFPYRSSAMPGLPASLRGSWIESAYNGYATEGTVARVKQLLDVAANFKNTRNVPVFCGEFGVYMPNSADADRVAWYKEVKNYLDLKDIPWTTWDYQEGFGLFEKGTNQLFEYDLNVPLLEALNFNAPPQKSFVIKPVNKGLTIYDDFVGQGIVASTGVNDGVLDYYNTDEPHAGDHAVYWTGVNQYETIGFDFSPNVDFSLLPDHDYQLSFWVRGGTANSSFDIRFVDTKTGASDHPWRMGKTIDGSIVPWDGQWHHVTIPLKNLEEKGSWDDAWFNPENKFDWAAVDRFEIVAEQKALTGIEFFFDDIEIVGEEIPEVTHVQEDIQALNLKCYPNPVSENSQIEFFLRKPEHVVISIYNLQGQMITTVFDQMATAGLNTVPWTREDKQRRPLPSGLYVIRVLSKKSEETTRVMVLNK